MKLYLLVFAVLGVVCAPISEADEVLKFRGVEMGTSIAAFKRTPYPDPGKRSGVFVVCSNDSSWAKLKYIENDISDEMRKAGVILCKYVEVDQFDKNSLSEWSPFFAGVDNYSTSYLFVGDTGQERLISVKIVPNAKEIDSITHAVIARYGEPSNVQVGEIAFKSGLKLPNRTSIWEIGDGRLEIIDHYANIDGMAVNYYYKPLLPILDQKLKGVAKTNADQL